MQQVLLARNLAQPPSRLCAQPDEGDALDPERVGDGLLPEGDDPIDVEEVLVERGFGRGPYDQASRSARRLEAAEPPRVFVADGHETCVAGPQALSEVGLQQLVALRR